MSPRSRILLGIIILAGLGGLFIGLDQLQRQAQTTPAAAGQTPRPAGSIPVFLDGQDAGAFTPDGLEDLQQVSFTDPVENKLQEGWLLADVLRKILPEDKLRAASRIVVSSSSRKKSAALTWEEAQVVENQVMFDLSNRGTLKLVAKAGPLSGREAWVQDVDRIEVTSP